MPVSVQNHITVMVKISVQYMAPEISADTELCQYSIDNTVAIQNGYVDDVYENSSGHACESAISGPLSLPRQRREERIRNPLPRESTSIHYTCVCTGHFNTLDDNCFPSP